MKSSTYLKFNVSSSRPLWKWCGGFGGEDQEHWKIHIIVEALLFQSMITGHHSNIITRYV